MDFLYQIYVPIAVIFLAQVGGLGVGSQVTSNTSINVELLIVCDKQFSDLFEQNRQRIIDFWVVQIFDVNMRFKTLTLSDITFHVTQLVIIQKTADQPFIEQERIESGDVNMWNAFHKFTKWISSNKQRFSEFDVAVLATGSQKVEKESTSMAEKEGACKDEKSALIIHFDSPWGNTCNSFASPLAYLLGAPPDSETPDSSGCKGNGYLRGKDGCGKNQFFFSKCSDAGISKYISSKNAKCLRTIDSLDDNTIISNVTSPPSLLEQCYSLTSNRNAVVAKGEGKCTRAKCYINKNGSMAFATSFYPLENSPCDTDKFCFRGRCLPTGYRLFNMGSRKCLSGGNRFSSSNYPVLVECAKLPTPLDQLRVFEETFGVFLATPYSSPDASENADKCISVDLKEENLQYSKCISDDKSWFTWRLIDADHVKGEFLLFHPRIKACAGVDHNNAVKMYHNCSTGNKWTRWKFYEKFSIPRKWFQTESTSSNSTNVTEGKTTEDSESDNWSTEINKWKPNSFLTSTSLPTQNANHSPHLVLEIMAVVSTFILLGVAIGLCALIYVLHRLRQSLCFNSDINNCAIVYSKNSNCLESKCSNISA